jgi:hypothetical protein
MVVWSIMSIPGIDFLDVQRLQLALLVRWPGPGVLGAPKREVAVTFLVVDTETRFVFAAVAVHISRGGPLVRLFFNFLKGKSILNSFI